VSRGAERGHLLFRGQNPLTIRQVAPANSPSELQNSASIDFYLRSAPASRARIEIAEAGGEGRRFTAEVEAHQGINRYLWPLRFDAPAPAVASDGAPGGATGGEGGDAGGGPRGGFRPGPQAGSGTYRVRLTLDGNTLESTVTVRDDPGLGLDR
jgi:hypothetical protein